jgi:hypothetical protein
MKTFACACGQPIFFENVSCMACGRELGFLPGVLRLSSLESAQNGLFRAHEAANGHQLYKKCQNYAKESVCNWMIPAGSPQWRGSEPFCASCRLNHTIPDLSRQQNHGLWQLMETAKRRLVYSLLNLNLPVANKADDPQQGLAFAFLEDQVKPDGSVSKVITGHDKGLITLNIAEADDAVRERIRMMMGEPHRTLLGHFRHEIGHYYWDRLIRGKKFAPRFRELFGNELASYGDALKRYYASGAPQNWQDNYISAYGTAHPWEDWAETWAHFMHIQDATEAARAFGLVDNSVRLDPAVPPDANAPRGASAQSSRMTMQQIIAAWTELTIALNSINRCMGLKDTYPFVLSPAIIDKLGFVFEVIADASAQVVAAS